MKKKKNQIVVNKEKKQKKVNRIFNSYHPILITLIIIIIIVVIYCNYLMKSSKLYMFNGTDDYVTVYNGVVSLNYDVNLLEGSHIIYLPLEDTIVTKYAIGYYVKDGDNLISLAVIEDEDEEGFSLRSLIEGVSTFNLTELNKNKKHFTKKTKKLIDNGLYFVIEATDKNGNEITNVTKMNITKLSK